jgi:hypothetical protein
METSKNTMGLSVAIVRTKKSERQKDRIILADVITETNTRKKRGC